MRGLVLFGKDKPNKYSWAILMGYIDQNPTILEHFDFIPLRFHLYKANEHLQEIQEQVDFSKYDVVIIAYSLLTIQIPQFEDFMVNSPDFFSQFHSNILTIVGGPHAKILYQDLNKLSFNIDYIVPDEGEIAFSQFLEYIIRGEKIENIAGLVNCESAKNQQNYAYIPPELVDLGSFPPFSERLMLFAPIEISRGCPFSCKFCQTGNQSRRMRHAPIEKVVGWVRTTIERGLDKVWFITPNIFAYQSKNGVTPNVEAIESLLSQLHKIEGLKGIYFGTFPSEVRPESITKEVLTAIKPYITNKKILLGAQTVSDDLLKSIHRGHTFQDVEDGIELLNEFGFKSEVDFIFGLPGETKQHEEANIQFLKRVLKGEIKNIKIHGHTFMALPGTPFENENDGELSKDILDILGKLGNAGKAYGNYFSQAGMQENRYSKKN